MEKELEQLHKKIIKAMLSGGSNNILLDLDNNFETITDTFRYCDKYIDYNIIIEIIELVKKYDNDILNYINEDFFLEFISKFLLKEQLNIMKKVNLNKKIYIEIILKLSNFSKNTKCCVCSEEKKCIPYSDHYLCTDCVISNQRYN